MNYFDPEARYKELTTNRDAVSAGAILIAEAIALAFPSNDELTNIVETAFRRILHGHDDFTGGSMAMAGDQDSARPDFVVGFGHGSGCVCETCLDWKASRLPDPEPEVSSPVVTPVSEPPAVFRAL